MGRLEVLSLAFDPTNSQTIYAGVYNETSVGGIFRSTDGGNNWENIGLQSEQVNSIAITSGENSFLYAGTGSGFFRSIDGGTTWIKSSFNKAVNAIKLNPGSANLVYVASNSGVYKSIDSGTTWIFTGLKDNNVISLEIDPNNQDIVYLGTDEGEFFSSTDSGKTWEQHEIVANEICCIKVDSSGVLYLGKDKGFSKSFDSGNTFKTPADPFDVGTVTTDPIDKNVIYAGTYNGVFQSKDSGLSWNRIGLDKKGIVSIAIDNKKHDILYAGTDSDGIFKSNDRGETWHDVTPWEIISMRDWGYRKTLSVYSFAINPTDTNKIFAGTSEGVLRSIDGGISWQLLGPSVVSVNRLQALTVKLDPINSNKIYVGTNFFGIFKSEDEGNNWTHLNVNASFVRAIAISPQNSNEIFAETFVGGLRKSEDGGDTWSQVKLPNGPNSYEIYAISYNPVNLKMMFIVAWYYISWDPPIFYPVFLESIDSGVTWKIEDTPKTILSMSSMCIDESAQIIYIGAHEGVYRFDISTEKGYFQGSGFGDNEISTLLTVDGTLFAGSYNGTVGRSVDNGKTWQYKAQYSNIIRTLVADPVNPSTIYAGTSLGILKSEDECISWKKIDSLNKDINSLLISPQNSKIMYAGTGEGIFKSVNGASSWIVSSNGLPEDDGVYSITFDPTNPSTLYAATYNAIFKSTDDANSWTLKKTVENGIYTIVFVDSKTIFAGIDQGILKSSDGGESWEESCINDTKVFSIKVDLKRNIFLGTDSGVLVSNDDGNSFTPIENGLTNYYVSSLAIDSNGTVYAGTVGSGIFKFLSKKYVLETKANTGGTIEPEGEIVVEEGTSQTIKITPSSGYKIKDVKVDGASIGALTTYTFENITSDHKIEATFEPLAFTITASAGIGGLIMPSGTIGLNYGESKTFTMTPNTGYKISDVKVDGNSVGSVSSYTFTNITSNHTISVTFGKEIIETVIILQIGAKNFTVNGETRTLDSPPIIKNGRTLLPIRAVVEALGGNVDWSSSDKKATVSLGKNTIELWIGKPQAKVNGTTKWIDDTNHKVVPEIINGRTMLPLRFVAESLGATVDWNGDTKTITITYLTT